MDDEVDRRVRSHKTMIETLDVVEDSNICKSDDITVMVDAEETDDEVMRCSVVVGFMQMESSSCRGCSRDPGVQEIKDQT
jgi:hypothetical protein